MEIIGREGIGRTASDTADFLGVVVGAVDVPADLGGGPFDPVDVEGSGG